MPRSLGIEIGTGRADFLLSDLSTGDAQSVKLKVAGGGLEDLDLGSSVGLDSHGDARRVDQPRSFRRQRDPVARPHPHIGTNRICFHTLCAIDKNLTQTV